MSLISVLKSNQSMSRLGDTWWQCMAPGRFKPPDCRQWFLLEWGSIPAFHYLHHPSLDSHSLFLPRSVKYFPLEGKESFVNTYRERWVFAGLLLTTSFPWSSIQALPGVCGWGFPRLLLTVRKDKQSQFIFPQLSPSSCGHGLFVLVSSL